MISPIARRPVSVVDRIARRSRARARSLLVIGRFTAALASHHRAWLGGLGPNSRSRL